MKRGQIMDIEKYKFWKKRQDIVDEVVDTLKLNELPLKTVPDYMRRKKGVWYWTGALITMAFVYQVISGLLLLIYYTPSDPYYNTVNVIIDTVPFGALFLASHLYGAYAMIVLIYIHLFRNYFMGAYKKPRRLQWITGVLLLAITIGVGFFGYSMTGDVLSSDATDVGRGIALSTPILGATLESLVFGNGTSLSLFTHMLSLHIVFTAIIGLLFGLHFFLAEANGMMPSNRKSKYTAPAVDKEDPSYKPWFPYNMAFMVQLALYTFGILIIIPSILMLINGSAVPASATNPPIPPLFSPFPSFAPTSPFAGYVPAYPPWFLLFIYKAVDFQIFTGPMSPLIASTVFGVVPLLYFLLIPFMDGSKDLHPLARPMVTAFGILAVIYMVILSAWGALSPGIPIPPSEVYAVFIPPWVIVVGGMYFLNRMYRQNKFKVTSTKSIASFLLFMFLLIFMVIELAENFSAFMNHTSALNLVSTALAGGATSFVALGTMKSAQVAEKYQPVKEPKQHVISVNTAVIISAILGIFAVAVIAMISTLNPVGVIPEGEFGLGLGGILVISGLIMRLYRAAFYHE